MKSSLFSEYQRLFVLVFAAFFACNGDKEVDSGGEEVAEPMTFSPGGSFDGPQENQNNWVEMSLGIDEDGDGLAELVIGRPIDSPDDAEVTGNQGMVYILQGGTLTPRLALARRHRIALAAWALRGEHHPDPEQTLDPELHRRTAMESTLV